MNDSQPIRMTPQEELWLRAEGTVDVQRLVSIAALGMCRALATGTVTSAYACQRLFGPALLARIEKLEAHAELRHAIHLASELEDVAGLVPDKLADSIAEIESKLLKVLADLAPGEMSGDKWLVKTPEVKQPSEQ
ncbi:DUF3969 family protein [Stigmatella aurantiaca]|uniref:Uncharacterized protein n=1 Tax=Stigmatella aurantiaca (strain DW4/3-1) TaxID=378806 RepID=E3FG65_STIAD|nr:DUF3969 family protein [Stigmatella aurantiaca]ADO69000.1 uncharacterized protein STAUR_1196 [Stigmatella aurantiaca DW4/3-1]